MNNIVKDVSEMIFFRTKFKSFQILIEELFLIALTDSYERLIHIQDINLLSENKIRNELQYDIEHNNNIITDYINNETITFNSEPQIVKENEIYRTDIKLFCSWFRRSFIIECKKFNPYNNDYIQGHFNKEKNKHEYNGIERFTERIYAEKDEYAGMLGFICTGDINIRFKDLKAKVRNYKLANNSEKLLNQKSVNWEFSFQSKHIKNNDSEIHLYHLLFDFRSKRNKKIDSMLGGKNGYKR